MIRKEVFSGGRGRSIDHSVLDAENLGTTKSGASYVNSMDHM